jgi:hypothetical protein
MVIFKYLVIIHLKNNFDDQGLGQVLLLYREKCQDKGNWGEVEFGGHAYWQYE